MIVSTAWTLFAALLACGEGGDDSKPQDSGPPAEGDPVDLDGDGAFSDTDCNDGAADVHPGATEICNGLDDDCTGGVDEGLATSFYRDADGDGFGDGRMVADACAQPSGFVPDQSDCDDTRADVNPDAAEICDLEDVDEDCNSLANEADPGLTNNRTWFVDNDEDGYGEDKTAVTSCFEAPGLATVGTDCNDDDYDINPGAPEVCDAADKDEDCDGLSDADDLQGPLGQPLYYADVDSDDDGDMADPGQYFCDGVPYGYSTLNTDCDDGERLINPDAPENCKDGIDNDCVGGIDDCGPIPDIDLSTADTIIESATSYVDLGWSATAAGDVNGDGQSDFAIGAYQYDSARGAMFVFYGPVAPETLDSDDDADSIIKGDIMYGEFGYAIDSAGDVNGDGYDDLIGGPVYYNQGAGYLFLGPFFGDMTTASADATWEQESTGDYAGKMVSGGYDFDGDDIDDYMVGADQADNGSYYSVGAAYLVLGPGTGSHSLADATVKFTGTTSYQYVGQAGQLVPDMDGDGTAEAVVGAPNGGISNQGRAYLFYGVGLAGTYLVETQADSHWDGTSSYDSLGQHLGVATDFNADGYGDLLVATTQSDTGTYSTGSVYVILGPGDTSGSINTVAQAEFYGEAGNDQAGMSTDGTMDVNRDGYTDVVVGAPYHASPGVYSTGGAFVVYGPQTGDMSLGNARVALNGIASYDQAGYGVSFIGDQSGDDSPEVLVGAPYASGSTGAAYVVWGDRL